MNDVEDYLWGATSLSLSLTPDSSPGGDHFNEGAKRAGTPTQTRCGPSNRHSKVAECPRLALLLLSCENIQYCM